MLIRLSTLQVNAPSQCQRKEKKTHLVYHISKFLFRSFWNNSEIIWLEVLLYPTTSHTPMNPLSLSRGVKRCPFKQNSLSILRKPVACCALPMTPFHYEGRIYIHESSTQWKPPTASNYRIGRQFPFPSVTPCSSASSPPGEEWFRGVLQFQVDYSIRPDFSVLYKTFGCQNQVLSDSALKIELGHRFTEQYGRILPLISTRDQGGVPVLLCFFWIP